MSISAQNIADIIEKMIDAKIKHHATPQSGGVPQSMNKQVNDQYVNARKRELADAIDSLLGQDR